MDFGKALELLKNGKKIAREGWNGKGMFLFLIKSNDWHFKFDSAVWGCILSSFIAMKTADNKIVPWLASQTDMLTDDWIIVE